LEAPRRRRETWSSRSPNLFAVELVGQPRRRQIGDHAGSDRGCEPSGPLHQPWQMTVEGKLTYHMGLEFTHREMADYWDIMYYSFTIAMCYQTSDVTITSVRIRRVTLAHAILSFLFVSAIIGFVVNVISNVA
jgi:hypothetical protein